MLKPNRLLISISIAFAAVLCIILVWQSNRDPLLSTPQGRAVDSYLRGSLNDPQYSVISWTADENPKYLREAYMDHLRREIEFATDRRAEALDGLAELKKNPLALELDYGCREKANKLNEIIATENPRIEWFEAEIKRFAPCTVAQSRICSLEFRARNAFNAWRIEHLIFIVNDGVAHAFEVGGFRTFGHEAEIPRQIELADFREPKN